MDGKLETLAAFHFGIQVPEFHTHVPWLIKQHELFRLISRDAFAVSPGGWPTLSFTLLGIRESFGFNFVTHPEERFVGVGFANDNETTYRQTFGDMSAILRKQLGPPNSRDFEDELRWDDGCVAVDNGIDTGYRGGSSRQFYSHSFTVRYYRVTAGQKLVLGNGQVVTLHNPGM